MHRIKIYCTRALNCQRITERYFNKMSKIESGMVVHTCSPKTWQAGVRKLRVWTRLGDIFREYQATKPRVRPRLKKTLNESLSLLLYIIIIIIILLGYSKIPCHLV